MKKKKTTTPEQLKEIYKTVEPTNEVCIKFTEDELVEFGWEPKQKFSVHTTEDGGVMFKKFEKLELDLEEWPIELIHSMIKESCDEDISINEVINRRLKISLEKLDLEEYEIKENK
jgi:hypothetical protein